MTTDHEKEGSNTLAVAGSGLSIMDGLARSQGMALPASGLGGVTSAAGAFFAPKPQLPPAAGLPTPPAICVAGGALDAIEREILAGTTDAIRRATLDLDREMQEHDVMPRTNQLRAEQAALFIIDRAARLCASMAIDPDVIRKTVDGAHQ